MNREQIKKQFLEDIKDHKMSIKQDNDLYRNLVFKREGSCTYWFGIQTWPGYLCIYGDMGTYVFSRTSDMFCFFRRDDLDINPGYWHEKLVSDSKYCGSQEFSRNLFKKHLKEDFETYAYDYDLSEEEKKELWEDIEISVLYEEGEEHLFSAAMDYKTEEDHRIFQDFYEHGCREYTHQFIWCLYAIVFAVKSYDNLTYSKEEGND